jgi:hypothetical protein
MNPLPARAIDATTSAQLLLCLVKVRDHSADVPMVCGIKLHQFLIRSTGEAEVGLPCSRCVCNFELPCSAKQLNVWTENCIQLIQGRACILDWIPPVRADSEGVKRTCRC